MGKTNQGNQSTKCTMPDSAVWDELTVKARFQPADVLSNSLQRLPALSELVFCTCICIVHRLYTKKLNAETNWKKTLPIFTLNLLQSTQNWQNSLC